MDTAYIRRPTARRLSEESICADSIGSRDLGEGKTSADPQGSFADENQSPKELANNDTFGNSVPTGNDQQPHHLATMKQDDKKPYPESGVATMPFQSSLNPLSPPFCPRTNHKEQSDSDEESMGVVTDSVKTLGSNASWKCATDKFDGVISVMETTVNETFQNMTIADDAPANVTPLSSRASSRHMSFHSVGGGRGGETRITAQRLPDNTASAPLGTTKRFGNVVRVQEHLCAFFSLQSQNDTFYSCSIHDVMDVTHTVIKAMHRFSRSEVVQQYGCDFLKNVSHAA